MSPATNVTAPELSSPPTRLDAACTVTLSRKNALLLALLCEIEGDELEAVVNDAVALHLDEWASLGRKSAAPDGAGNA